MNTNKKKFIRASIISAALIIGLVLSAWFYRTDALTQHKNGKEELPYLSLTNQSHVFDNASSIGFSMLEKHAESLSNESQTKDDVIVARTKKLAKNTEYSLFTIVGKGGLQRTADGNRYALAAVDGTYQSAELAAENKAGAFLLVIAGILALLFFGVFLYITQKRFADMDRERARYIRDSVFDPLTGLYNMHGFEDAAKIALSALPADQACVIVAFEVVSFRIFSQRSARRCSGRICNL